MSERGSDGCLVCSDPEPCNCSQGQECVSTVRLCDQCPKNECVDPESSSAASSGAAVSDGDSGGGDSAASIAGPVVGALVGAVLILLGAWFFWRRRRNAKVQSSGRESARQDTSNAQPKLAESTVTSQGGGAPGSADLATYEKRAGDYSTPEDEVEVVIKRSSMQGRTTNATHRRSYAEASDNSRDPFDDTHASVTTPTSIGCHPPTTSTSPTYSHHRASRQSSSTDIPQSQDLAPQSQLSYATTSRTNADNSKTGHLRNNSQSSILSETSNLSYILEPAQISTAKAVNLNTSGRQVLQSSPLARVPTLTRTPTSASRMRERENQQGSPEDSDLHSDSDTIRQHNQMSPHDPPSPGQTLEPPKSDATADKTASMHTITSVTSSRADSMLEGIPFEPPKDVEDGKKEKDANRVSLTPSGGSSTFGYGKQAAQQDRDSRVSTPQEPEQEEDPFDLPLPRRPFAGETPHSEFRRSQRHDPKQGHSSVDSRGSDMSGGGSVLEGIPFHLAVDGDLERQSGGSWQENDEYLHSPNSPNRPH